MLLESQANIMVIRKDSKIESIRYLSEKLLKKLLYLAFALFTGMITFSRLGVVQGLTFGNLLKILKYRLC